jgi:hypothetical protein
MGVQHSIIDNFLALEMAGTHKPQDMVRQFLDGGVAALAFN